MFPLLETALLFLTADHPSWSDCPPKKQQHQKLLFLDGSPWQLLCKGQQEGILAQAQRLHQKASSSQAEKAQQRPPSVLKHQQALWRPYGGLMEAQAHHC